MEKPTQLLNRVGSILLNNDDGKKTHSRTGIGVANYQ